MGILKQKHRVTCLSAIKEVYGDVAVDLMADRLGRVYWSIWRFKENLLEAIEYEDRVEIGTFVPVDAKIY